MRGTWSAVFLGLLSTAAPGPAPGIAQGAEVASAEDLPRIIPDDSAADWVVDRFAGNSTAGPEFIQGPAREVGGLGRCGACPTPEGRVYIPFSAGLAEVSPDGTLRLVVSDPNILQRTTGQTCAGAGVAWNPTDKMLYVAGRNCVRRLRERPGGPPLLEPVAGVPGMPGCDDGPAARATFTRIDSIVINGRGTMYILDNNERIRCVEGDRVTTLNANVRSGKLADGPLGQAAFNMIGLGGNLCGGEDDDTLYLSDHWNFCVRRISLRDLAVSTVAGMPKPGPTDAGKRIPQQKRYNANCDGPALTWASFNSGCAYVCWDPVHKALWCGGPDENRCRWLRDGWLRTVIGAKGAQDKWPKDAVGVPADQVFLAWNAVVAVDEKGRAYLSCSGEPTGLWRAYPRREAPP